MTSRAQSLEMPTFSQRSVSLFRKKNPTQFLTIFSLTLFQPLLSYVIYSIIFRSLPSLNNLEIAMNLSPMFNITDSMIIDYGAGGGMDALMWFILSQHLSIHSFSHPFSVCNIHCHLSMTAMVNRVYLLDICCRWWLCGTGLLRCYSHDNMPLLSICGAVGVFLQNFLPDDLCLKETLKETSWKRFSSKAESRLSIIFWWSAYTSGLCE